MSGAWAIYRRELLALFVTPLAWTLLFVFLALQGMHFFWIAAHVALQPELSVDQGPVEMFFGGTMLLYLPLLLVAPLLTMRAFAEERRSGTIELLLTVPVTPAAIVLGKYGALLTTYVVMWIPTLLLVALVAGGGGVDAAVVASSYLGVLGIGAGYLAVGTLMSAMARSQLVAALLTAVVLLGLFLLGVGEFVLDAGPLRDACGYLSVWTQMEEMSRGIVDARRLVLDATLIVLPLFLTARAVEAWRWE